MSVDFPTPDDPRNAAVRPGPRWARSASTPAPVSALIVSTGTPTATSSVSARRSASVAAEVGLVEDDHRLDAASPGEGEVALQPAHVEVMVECHDDEDGVDVRRHDLFLRARVPRAGPVCRLADERARSR